MIKERHKAGMVLLLTIFVFLSCGSPVQPEGLAESGGGTGPAVYFDPLATPVPEIPFPNDLATVLDPSTPTGRRINISTNAPTEVERDIRRSLNTLDGFGTYSTISIRFDAPVDLKTITEGNVIVVQTVGPRPGNSPRLDLGKGFFPFIWSPDRPWWAHDPYRNANNVAMDPANMADQDGDTVPEFVDFYEFETNTLLVRNLQPLDESSRYAVVILKGMTGLDGQSVRSPFKYINHTMQTGDLQPLLPILQARGIPLEQVAFTWSFTTQTVNQDWINIYNGLYNATGPLAYLAWTFPPILLPTDLKFSRDGDGNSYIINAQWFEKILKNIATLIGEEDYVAIAKFDYVDYFVFGKFESPSFFSRLNFGHPLYTDAIYFDPARLSGAVPADRLEVTWMLTVPRDEDQGLDPCLITNPPFGCRDYEETGAAGPDGGFGIAGFDDNNDGFIDDTGEYMMGGALGDDVPDPFCDNKYPSNDDFPQHCKDTCFVGGVPIADPITGACAQTQGNGLLDASWPYTEDANGDGRLNTPPFPVAFWGHGHTSSRVESIGFAEPSGRLGIALFGMDNFGHGPMTEFGQLDKLLIEFIEDQGLSVDIICTVPEMSQAPCNLLYDANPSNNGLIELIGADLNGDHVTDINDVLNKSVREVLYETFQLPLFQVLGTEGRAYDIDGDTVPDSGDIFWTANILQTRDLVRQTAIDWLQFSRVVDNLGIYSHFDLNGDTVPDLDGDLNLDGRNDLGGPNNPRGQFFTGSSLGGIMGDINMGMNPRMMVGVPVAGAGGLPDVIPRSHQRSATRPVMLQICGPVIVGSYAGVPGRATITLNDDPSSKAVGHLYMPDAGRVMIVNRRNGETEYIVGECDENNPNCGPGQAVNFAVGIPSDIGDPIEIISLDDRSGMVQSVVKFNSPYKGHGVKRNSPDFRRFLALSQWAIERGDAINLAPHYFTNAEGSPLPGFPDKAILQVDTSGDQNVPINTGNAIATAAGLWTVDQAQWLIDKGVNLGNVPKPYATTDQYQVPIFDAEDLDDDGLSCGFAANDAYGRCTDSPPFAMPLPPVPSGASGMVSAVRWPYISERAHHAFALPIPDHQNHGIDWGVYMGNQISYYWASDGTCIIDDPYELRASPMIMPGPDGVLDTTPSGNDQIRTIRVLTTLGTNPCNYPFPEIQVITAGADFTDDDWDHMSGSSCVSNGQVALDTVPANDDVMLFYDCGTKVCKLKDYPGLNKAACVPMYRGP